MYGPFSHLQYRPCPDCGASVRADDTEHECDPERKLDYELFQLRDDLASLPREISVWLDTPHGRFAAYIAERR